MGPIRKRVKREFIQKNWTSNLPRRAVSESVWGQANAQDIAFYVDWHARHPFCVTPRKLLPGEEKLENEVYDEDDSSMVYSKIKPRSDQGSDYFNGGYKNIPIGYKPKIFGVNGNFDEVSVVSHLDYNTKRGKYKTVLVSNHVLSDEDGEALTISSFESKTAESAINSTTTETICAKTVKDYMSESHLVAYESKQAEILAMNEAIKKKLKEEKIKLEIEKELERKNILEQMYISQRWGMIK